jgi:hypothetical protein
MLLWLHALARHMCGIFPQKYFFGMNDACCPFQVHKQGMALGRSVDLTKFNGYTELVAELDEMFDFNGELKGCSKEWMVVYTDYEGDMMLVGDDPWK